MDFRRGAAALGDAWHFGVVTVTAAQRSAVGDVLGLRRGNTTGKVTVPGGVAYVVAARPSGPGTQSVTAALTNLRDRYDPVVLVLVETTGSVTIGTANRRLPVAPEITDAVDAFFAAAGEPATLPGYGGRPPFPVHREPLDSPEAVAVARFRRGGRWLVVGGPTTAETDAAQTLRYLIPYVRPRLQHRPEATY